MKIAVSGLGYVGLSNAILLAQHNEVVALDVIAEKVDMINRRESPIIDTEIEEYLKTKTLNLKATLDKVEAYTGAAFCSLNSRLFQLLKAISHAPHIDNSPAIPQS